MSLNCLKKSTSLGTMLMGCRCAGSASIRSPACRRNNGFGMPVRLSSVAISFELAMDVAYFPLRRPRCAAWRALWRADDFGNRLADEIVAASQDAPGQHILVRTDERKTTGVQGQRPP